MRIAITGGIASGKSVVTKIFKQKGFKTASADEINEYILNEKKYIRLLKKHFPDCVTEKNEVNKYALREAIFSDEKKRELLNSLAHPIIIKKIKSIKGNTVIEIPLLVELGLHSGFDKVIAVTAPVEKRIERIKNRNGFDENFSRKIIASQATDEQRFAVADYVINTDCSLEEVEHQVEDIIISLK
jgi:dephospho-CoA kinase